MVDVHHYIYRDMDVAGEGAVALLVPTGSWVGCVSRARCSRLSQAVPGYEREFVLALPSA